MLKENQVAMTLRRNDALSTVFGDEYKSAGLIGQALLIIDLELVQNDNNDAGKVPILVKEAAEILRDRLGGVDNLQSYLDCLHVGFHQRASDSSE